MRRYLLLLITLISLISCSSTPPDPVGEVVGPEYLERGRVLVKGLAACGFCHAEKPDPSSLLVGGRTFYDKFGEVKAPNLTPTSGSAISRWNTAEIIRTIRNGIRPSGEPYFSLEAHDGFQWLSETDALSIVAFLKSLPGYENQVEVRDLSFIERNTTGFFDVKREVKGYVPSIRPDFSREYGQYLVDNVARCGSCHNSPNSLLTTAEYLTGGATVHNDKGEKLAPGITASRNYGIGTWSEYQIVNYLKTGVKADGVSADPNFCPIRFYRTAPERDLLLIARYLLSVGAGG